MKPLGYALLCLLLMGAGCASPAIRPSIEAGSGGEVRVAVMPFADYGGHGEAGALLLPRLTTGLRDTGLVVVPAENLRRVLRKHRIRSQGMVGRREAQTLTRELDLDFLVLGSWDVYETGQNPELGCSVRILDTRSLDLIKAVSVDRTGADSRGLLGLGGVDSLSVLADKVVGEALKAILPLNHRNVGPGNNLLVAVVALDNLASKEHSGAICGSILLSRLMAAGYPVVEPGFLREMQLDLETGFRGGIDRKNLRALVDRFPVTMVITGTVDVFAPAAGAPNTTVPRVALGLRVINPQTGRLLMTQEIDAGGGDDDGLFLQGRIHGVADLAAKALDRFVKALKKKALIPDESRNP